MQKRLTRRAVLGGMAASASTALLAASGGRTVLADGGGNAQRDRRVPPIVQQWADAWNAQAPAQMAALFTADGVYEDFAFEAQFQGQQGVALWVSITTASIRDVKVEIIDAFRRGDRAAVTWRFSGTDIGAIAPDLPPTGKFFSVPATSFFELDGPLISRVSDYYNLATLLRQIGLPAGAYVPPTATP